MNRYELADVIQRELYAQKEVVASGMGNGRMYLNGFMDTARLADAVLEAIAERERK